MDGVTYNELLLKIDNVSLNRDDGTLVLRDVNAEIYNIRQTGYTRGQVVGFLGPSGIGKTTLFEIMAGLLQPTTGSVAINNEKTPVRAGQVGVVSQHYLLFDHRTVLANLVVAGKQAGMTYESARKKAKEILGRFGMQDRMNHYPAQLSGGQRQRVAIAQQLMCSEHFLLMDEPFSGLDVIAKDTVCQLISEVSSMDELNTIIVVTHDIQSALRISDHIWLMGRDRDETGAFKPGARIMTEYNLIDLGLAWHSEIDQMPEFTNCLREITAQFRNL